MNNGFLRQSTASQSRVIGPFLDDTDFKTPETALTISNTDVRLSKNAGSFANKNSGGGTHMENGYYSITLDATDTNTVGELIVKVNESGALPVVHKFVVLEEAIYDALFASGAAVVPANVTQWLGSAAATPTVAGVPEVDVTHWLGTAAATPTVAGVPEVDVTHRGGVASGTASLIEMYCGGVWFDGTAGGTGTTVGTHGVPGNPVNSFSDAIALAASTKLRRIYFADASGTIAPTDAFADVEIIGIGVAAARILNIGSAASITQTRFRNVTVVGGPPASTGFSARDCILQDTAGIGSLYASDCTLAGSIVVGLGTYRCNDCHTQDPTGGATPIIDLGTNNSNFVARRFAGKLDFRNMDSTNLVDIEGTGAIRLMSTCVGGTVTVRGQFEIIDESSGAVTINNAGTGVNLTQIGGSSTDLETFTRLLNVLEVFTITGASSPTDLVCGTLAATTDDAYIDRAIVFDKATPTVALRGRPGWVRDYVGSTKTLIVDTLSNSPQVGDFGVLLA